MPILYQIDGSVTLQDDADAARVAIIAAGATPDAIDAAIRDFFAPPNDAGE